MVENFSTLGVSSLPAGGFRRLKGWRRHPDKGKRHQGPAPRVLGDWILIPQSLQATGLGLRGGSRYFTVPSSGTRGLLVF